MSTEDKGQASGLEVELAVPGSGTEQTQQPPTQDPPLQQEDEEGEVEQVQAQETDEDRSARAERRRRSREQRRQREEQMLDAIARQGEIIENLVGQVQGLSGHAQGSQAQQIEQAYLKAKADMATAYESGKPDAVAEATEALTIARLNLDAMRHRRTAQPQRRPQGQDGGEQRQQPNPYQAAWLDRNQWYRDPERIEDAEIAFGISRALVADGYPENDPEHFAELDRRLKKRGVSAAPARSQHEAPKTIVASGQRQSLGPSKTKVTLTTNVQEHARRFGLDLNDPKTRERIARRFAPQQAR